MKRKKREGEGETGEERRRGKGTRGRIERKEPIGGRRRQGGI
jgi:hypothetical protein